MISTVIQLFLSAIFYELKKFHVLSPGGNYLLVAGEYTLQVKDQFLSWCILVLLTRLKWGRTVC